jgi:phosphatidylglycerophosphatase A
VRRLERLHGGAGIMLDDLGAGVYGLLVVLVVRMWW